MNRLLKSRDYLMKCLLFVLLLGFISLGATATAQNKQNLANNCGYSGPRWSSDYEGHLKWCIDVSAAVEDRENIARIGQLAKRPALHKWCDIYSIIAVAQNDANLSAGCNETGNRWQSNYKHHYDWCVPCESAKTPA